MCILYYERANSLRDRGYVMAYALIDWNIVRQQFTVRGFGGEMRYADSAERALVEGSRIGPQVRVNEAMQGDKLVELMAAAIFKRVPLCNMEGKEITETPVPDANVRYITRKEIGAVLPDGWYIECQLNRYAACWGEAMTFPARRSIVAAIADIHEFLAASIKQATDDLLESVVAQRARSEERQASMWVSSDRAKPAMDASIELDTIA